jgi:fermentation-respiration switch protein FrsA (DUF1100 family)
MGRLGLIACIAYLIGAGVLAAFQRTLIYIPTRQQVIEPAEAEFPTGQVHTIEMPAGDGLQLRGWHLLPDGTSARNLEECDLALQDGRPVVLYFSGNAGNRTYRGAQFAVLTRLGCHVLVFDYRGYGDNPGSPSENEFAADAQAAWRYATDQRRIAPERIILFGESLGGGVATRLAAEVCRGGRAPRGLALRATFTSLVDAAAYHYPWLPVRWAMLDRFPSIDRIPEVTCPVLHIHGTADRIVPIQMGRKLFEAAPPQSLDGVPKRFVELPDVGHNDIMYVAEAEVQEAIAEWLGQLAHDGDAEASAAARND